MQKKNVDIWLIYRCTKRDNTCSIAPLSRTKPDSTDEALFHSFSMDDQKAIWKYAFSAGLTGRNHLKTDHGGIEYEVMDNFSKEDIIHISDAIIKTQIKCEFEFSLKLSSLSRRNFLLSSTQLRRLFEQGVIPLLSGREPQKHKVKSGDILLAGKEHLLVMVGSVGSSIVKTGIG